MNNAAHQTGMALDVGERRVGVATAHLAVRFARPLTTLEQPDSFVADIIDLVRQEAAAWIVLGLPRGLDGQETAQTGYVRNFRTQLEAGLQEAGIDMQLYWTDEAVTSAKAEQELQDRRAGFKKADIDALAAMYILEDFLLESAPKTGRIEHG